MTHDNIAGAIFYGLIVLALAAGLIGRRVSLLRIVRLAAVWALIFAVGLVLYGERARFEPYLARAGRTLGLDNQEVVGREVRIRMAADGHFWATVRIGDVRKRMLIDSGATVTALSSDTADAAGVERSNAAMPMLLRTANGTIAAESGAVGELRLGDIVARHLDVVVSPAFGDTDVLGMNFLSRLKSWRVEDGTLILTPHHPKDFT